MLVLWMGYAVLVGLVIVGVAAIFERGIHGRRRWLWAGAQLLAVTLPLVRPLLKRLTSSTASLDVVFGPILPAVRGALPDLDVLGAAAASSTTLADLQGPLIGAWLGASVVLAVLVIGGMLRIRRLRRGWEHHRLDGTDVLLTDALGPAVVGIRRPQIVVPAWVLELSTAERGLILAHEDEHRRTGDPALLAASLALPVLLPWNPAAWLAFRRLRDAVETDCDARVVRRAAQKPLHYARLLLEVSTRTAGIIPVGAGFSERRSSLERRVRALLGATLPFGWKGLVARLVVAAVVVAAACSLEVNINTPSETTDEARATYEVRELPTPSAEPAADATDARTTSVYVPRPPTPSEVDEALKRPTEEIQAAPTFTPFTVTPSILNRDEIVAAMVSEYPPLLREAGIGGTVKVYFFIDADGTVGDVRLDEGSGHQALDEAALRVADKYRFQPALNRDQKVPVWVSFPITFQVRR